MLNGWLGEGKENRMEHDFQYISKHDPKVRAAYANLTEILRRTQDLVREEFTFQFYPVGSFSRNMITYDAKSNVGYDFDINIEVNDDEEAYSAKEIRDILRNALSRVAPEYGYSHAKDSTRVITIKMVDHGHSRILHSCDFAVVHNYSGRENRKPMQQYIRFRKETQSYFWCQQSKGYDELPEKVKWLKRNSLWGELRNYYRSKKNANTDADCHSRTIFAISVHEMCQKYGYYPGRERG